MRTTLDIDVDILAALKERANADGTTVSRLASDLLRQALSFKLQGHAGFGEEQAHFEPISVVDDWVVLKSRGGIVTTDLVRRLEDETAVEDLERAVAARR